MKKYFFALIAIIAFCFCSCGLVSQSGSEQSQDSDEEVITDNINDMLKQIDRAIKNRNFDLAHNVLRSFPPKFDGYGRIWYDEQSGEIGADYSHDASERYTYEQYVKKAIQVLKSESDILLTKNDPEAEDLYLEYLADFDLGVNTVNLGEFSWADSKTHENERYQTAVTAYNDYIITVIRKALLKGNVDLAEKLEFLVRDGLSFTTPNDSFDYVWQYDKEAKDEARELIDSYKANH